MSQVSLPTSHDAGFEQHCLEVLASQVGITTEDWKESDDALNQLLNTLLHTKSSFDLLQVIPILQQEKVSPSKGPYTISSWLLSHILLNSRDKDGQEVGLHLLLNLLDNTRNCLSTNEETFQSLQHTLISSLRDLFIDEKQELRFRTLTGKLLVQVLLECQFDTILLKQGEASFASVVHMLALKVDVVLRLFASIIIQICGKHDVVVWTETTKHRDIFFKHFDKTAEDPVQAFHTYVHEIGSLLYGQNSGESATSAPLCYLLQSVSIDTEVLAEGSILVALGCDCLRMIHSVDSLPTKSFKYIEVPLNAIRLSQCFADLNEGQMSRLELYLEESRFISIDGKNQFLDLRILRLVSGSDLTALNAEIQKGLETRSSTSSGAGNRRQSSFLLSLDSADQIGRTLGEVNAATEKGIELREYTEAQSPQRTGTRDSSSPKENRLVYPESYEITFGPSIPKKGGLDPVATFQKRLGLAEERLSTASDRDIGEGGRGRGQILGTSLAEAFQSPNIPQETEREPPPASVIENPGSRSESWRDFAGKGDSFISDEHSQGQRKAREEVGTNIDDFDARLRKTLVDSHGSPRLISQERSKSMLQSKRPGMESSVDDGSNNAASLEELLEGALRSEGDSGQSNPGERSGRNPNIASDFRSLTDNQFPQQWACDSDRDHPYFSPRFSEINPSEMQHDVEDLRSTNIGGSGTTHSFMSCLKKPEGCSCLSQPSKRPESPDRTQEIGDSQEQSARGSEKDPRGTEQDSPEAEQDHSGKEQDAPEPGRDQQAQGEQPSESKASDGEALTDSNVSVETQLVESQRARSPQTLQERAKEMSKATNRQLARQLEDERKIVGQILEHYRQECNQALDRLLEEQEERIQACEEHMNTILQQHDETCESLIHRLREDEQRMQKRTSLHLARRLNVIQGMERRGQKRRRLNTPEHRTDSGNSRMRASRP